jgi:hypothetical protein
MASIIQQQNEIRDEVAILRARLDELLARIGKPADRSISGFCRRQGISRATYYNLKHKPREVRANKRVLITPEAESDWERENEGVQKTRKRRPRS